MDQPYRTYRLHSSTGKLFDQQDGVTLIPNHQKRMALVVDRNCIKYIKISLGEKDAYVFPLHVSFADTRTIFELRAVELDSIPLWYLFNDSSWRKLLNSTLASGD